MICLRRIRLVATVMQMSFLHLPLVVGQVAESEDILRMLEEPAPVVTSLDEDQTWNVLHLKASYRHYYRLHLRFSDDLYGVPYTLNGQDKIQETYFANRYGSDSKIQLSPQFYSYIRFNYSFIQIYDHRVQEYRNTPDVDLYEAYLDYQRDNHRVQLGGLILRLGRIDFDSPIDILHLRDPDKVNHLDDQDAKYIMPAVKYVIQHPASSWTYFWGPFQRVSEKSNLYGQMWVCNIDFPGAVLTFRVLCLIGLTLTIRFRLKLIRTLTAPMTC